jgi:NAD+ synthase (glutamine-hydrolysing)
MVGDKWTDDNFVQNLIDYNAILQDAADGIVVVYGNVSVHAKSKGHDGRSMKFNSAYVCENKEIIAIRHKSLLPNYRIFDDQRYFTSGKNQLFGPDRGVVTLENGVKIGVEVCEDMWWEDYDFDVTKVLLRGGADFIINVSCSPWTYGKGNARDKVIHRMKDNLKKKFRPFYYVNAVGVQNNGKNIITFDGDSRAYNEDGYKLTNHLPAYEEGILYFDKHAVDTGQRDLLPQKSKIEEKFDAIIRAYKGLDEMMEWKPNYVFGLSGGVDSSLSATLAVLALGKERVKGFNLPSIYNAVKTKDAARQLAENLDISFEIVPIFDMVEANTSSFLGLKDFNLTSVMEENIQAKVRGTSILSNLAAMHNGVMTNNGNKLEIALGYATLYGDVNGVFAPLGDLTKAEVFEMCRFINERYDNPIPTDMLPINDLYDFPEDGIAPSAELKEEQLDPMKFGYHDRMIEMIMDFKKKNMEDFAKAYLNGNLSTFMGIKEELLTKYNLNDPQVFIDDLEWFFKAVQKSIFKRIQAPPVVLLSKTAYGYDYRESQFAFETSLKYDELRSRIL